SISVVLSPDARLEDMLQAVFNLLVGTVDFLVDQGAIGRLVDQGIGEALRACRYAFASVEVEETHGGQEGRTGGTDFLLHACCRDVLSDDYGYVAKGRGEARYRLEIKAVGDQCEDLLEIKLACQHGTLAQVKCGCGLGM